MSATIRNAKKEDAYEIAKVHVEGWKAAYKNQIPDEYLEKLSVEEKFETWQNNLSNPKPGVSSFAAEEDEHIIGFCSVGPSRDEDTPRDTGELYAIYVEPSRVGTGVGSSLHNAGLDFLRENGYKEAVLWVLKTNKTTISFYERKGWKSDGAEKEEVKEEVTLQEIRYRIPL